MPMSAVEWFASGRRVGYSPEAKSIVPEDTDSSISVFEKKVSGNGTCWITFLPGFPDGSYGFSRIEKDIQEVDDLKEYPRLYIEYVGQGDSDKPLNYRYGTLERADLVESQWKAHEVESTVVVTFDYSSLILMELLKRRQQRASVRMTTKVDHILIVNGGLFVDGHSHPWYTTPMLQIPFVGRIGAWFVQQSTWIFRFMMKPLFGKEYNVTNAELDEMEIAIKRRDGASFLALAAGFVSEHKRIGWNLQELIEGMDTGITIHLVGSEHDPFEHKQLTLARKRLKDASQVTITIIPGGHMSTSEQTEALVGFIHNMTKKIKD